MRTMIKKIPIVGNSVWTSMRYFYIAWSNQKIKKKIKNTPNSLKIVIGSSNIYEQGWIATDISNLEITRERDWELFFSENSIDNLMAEHVWEHMTESDGFRAAQNCYKYLKKGGKIRIAVPDGFHPSTEYINEVKVNGTGLGADDHKVLYSYQTLKNQFENAGFRVYFVEYFDEDGIFHDSNWNNADGKINRSKKYDTRNIGGQLNYTSIIMDAVKE